MTHAWRRRTQQIAVAVALTVALGVALLAVAVALAVALAFAVALAVALPATHPEAMRHRGAGGLLPLLLCCLCAVACGPAEAAEATPTPVPAAARFSGPARGYYCGWRRCGLARARCVAPGTLPAASLGGRIVGHGGRGPSLVRRRRRRRPPLPARPQLRPDAHDVQLQALSHHQPLQGFPARGSLRFPPRRAAADAPHSPTCSTVGFALHC